jgi:hypothetical protein
MIEERHLRFEWHYLGVLLTMRLGWPPKPMVEYTENPPETVRRMWRRREEIAKILWEAK